MNVWLVTIGEPLPIGDTDNRLLRAGLLAEALVQRGHDVTWWSSTFDHFKKQHLFSQDTVVHPSHGLTLRLLHGLGYSKNLSLARIVDHLQLAWKFRSQSRQFPPPDIIHCSMPPIELSLAVASYGKSTSIPVVLDMRDMWPDIFVEHLPSPLQSLGKIILFPWFQMLRRACQQAFAISGMTPAFVNWGLSHANREKRPSDRDFPFGYPDKPPSPIDLQEAKDFWSSLGIGLDSQETIFCFFGAIGPQFDWDSLFSAARNLQDEFPKLRFVICGNGDLLPRFKKDFEGASNVVFPGWIDHAKIWHLLRLSKIGLAPYLNKIDFQMSLPNKIIEYLSAGLPVLTPLEGISKNILLEGNCAFFYSSGSPTSLSATIRSIIADENHRRNIGGNAQRLFQQHFSAQRVYSDFSAYLEEIALRFAS